MLNNKNSQAPYIAPNPELELDSPTATRHDRLAPILPTPTPIRSGDLTNSVRFHMKPLLRWLLTTALERTI